jgi:hypothetical protein
MAMNTQSRLAPWSACLAAVLLVACQPKAIPMTPEETKVVSELTNTLSTRCMGRYLIDLPEKFKLYSYSETKIEGVEVAVEPMPLWKFEITLDTKQKQLMTTKLLGSRQDFPFVRAITPLPAPMVGVLIDRAESSHAVRAARQLEVFGWRDGYLITASIKASDSSFPEHSNDPEDVRGNDTPEKTALLLKVYARLSGRKDTEIPTEQGLCFANGFMKGPPSDEAEVMMRHLFDQVPDVSTTFRSLSGLEQDTELLDRGKSIEAMLKAEEGRTVRKGKAQAQLPDAQEWLMTKKNQRTGLWRHHMTLEANAKTGSAQTPVLIFNFGSGGDYSTTTKDLEEEATRPPLKANTLSEAQSVALWDKITATLRPRPGAF